MVLPIENVDLNTIKCKMHFVNDAGDEEEEDKFEAAAA